ncbi:MAG: nuclear transport factor 2 family protein [Thermoleophilaceae bacterium]|nr:nuclear transport factor 2 family protein [Thermoleophilaceae bacterium]
MSDVLRVLQRGYEMIWREDRLEEALIGLGPDFEWVVPNHPEGDVRHGAEATIAFFRDWVEPWEELHVEWDLYPAEPDRVLAILTMHGRGRESGAPVDMRVGQLWRFREGRAVQMVLYYDVDEARRAAGLTERSLASLAREGIAAYQRGGFDAVISYLAEDVVWEEDPEWPDGQTWHGHDGVRAAFRERLESTSIAAELEEVIERGGRVLVLMRWTAEGQGSGAMAVLRPGVIYEFEGELVKRAQFYLDRDRARAAFESD